MKKWFCNPTSILKTATILSLLLEFCFVVAIALMSDKAPNMGNLRMALVINSLLLLVSSAGYAMFNDFDWKDPE